MLETVKEFFKPKAKQPPKRKEKTMRTTQRKAAQADKRASDASEWAGSQETLTTEQANQLVRNIFKLREHKEHTAKITKKINEKIDTAVNRLMKDMKANGVDTFKCAGVGSVRIDKKIKANMPSGTPEYKMLVNHIKNTKGSVYLMRHILTMSSTNLNNYIKELTLEMEEDEIKDLKIPGIDTIHILETPGYTKDTKRKRAVK